jgi:hypothetical protein
MSDINIKSQTGIANFEEFVGDTLKIVVNYKSNSTTFVNLTNYSATFQIKTNKFIPLLTLTSNDNISLGNGANNIIVTVSDQQTKSLGKGLFLYDLQLTDSLGFVNTLLEGKIVLKQIRETQ